MKTQWCEECRHFDGDLLDRLGRGNPCTKGHRPRFYNPKNLTQAHTGIYGWKRRCEDFEGREK